MAAPISSTPPEAAQPGRSRRALGIALLFAAAGLALLLSLGLWQLQRLQWKEALIAVAETRISAAPGPLPAAPAPEADQFRPVVVRGRYAEEPETLIATSRAPDGPGFRVVEVFEAETPGGAFRRILVDRGYVPSAKRDPASRPESLRSGGQELSGVLRWFDEGNFALPAPDLDKRLWFERDVPALAAALGTEPVMILAADEDPTALPLADPPDVSYRNKHLEYAGTWFSLAAAWALMSFFWLRRLASGRPDSGRLDSGRGGGV
ncbi:SURF1 family protein [Neomegalonema sp.]|uniref:SURF1 family protein n=1 Tax=Neomegalonema sp. TaxID=2039713 RepID=UPI002630FC53|nr:SURF1 family protein [Neomegalonema sp.]MDD2869007.1 SURF1 family protein [Neomegalonema sp.]